ncbi:MAG: DUF167 domain-containing protein [Candidatus Aminicenantes bacterium]|nr:DUF167 domain-containing protein [Candidatus Aminicenantes bacterium]
MKTLLNVKVQPRSSAPGIERTGERELKVRVKAAPDKGRANAEVIELLSEHFHVPRSCVTIARGATSRNKVIVIETEKEIKLSSIF